MRRVAAVAALWAATVSLAQAGGVVMLSGSSAAQGRVESGLRFANGTRLDVDAIVRGARARGANGTSTILFHPDTGMVQRLEELPPDRRVLFSCLAQESEIYEPSSRSLSISAPDGLDPAAWVEAGSGRLVWWPKSPDVVACGLPVALLDVVPGSLAFGDVIVGGSAQRDAVVSNIGRIALDLGTVSIEGTGYSLVQNGCSAQRLLPGTNCALRVSFAPPASGDSAGRVRLPNSGLQPGAELPLSGRGVRPAAIVVDPAALAFGDGVIGTRTQRSVGVSNGGDLPLPLGTMTLAGTGFALVSNTCDGVTLAPAASCLVAVEFAPGASGAFAGTLGIVRADAGAAVDVALSARGLTAAHLVATPSSVAFGDVAPAATVRRSVTLSNEGEADLPLATMSVSGNGFSITANACDGVTLAAAQSCAIEVGFTPAAPGMQSGALQLARADAGSAIEVALSARGLAPAALSIDPTSVAFGDVVLGAAPRRRVTLRNEGEVPLPLGTMSTSGDAFSIMATDCNGRALAAAQSCSIEIEFLPGGIGAQSGSVHVARDHAAAASVALSGTGVAPGALATDPLTVEFGAVTLGAVARRGVTLSNTGGTSLMIGHASVAAGMFSVVQDGCSQLELAPAASCAIELEFAPDTADAASGTLSIPHGSADSTAVPLQGTGMPTTPSGPAIFRSGFE